MENNARQSDVAMSHMTRVTGGWSKAFQAVILEAFDISNVGNCQRIAYY